MDQRTPPSGFYSYNSTRSAQPQNQHVYRSGQGPPMPMPYAASPMTFGYNYGYNQAALSTWSAAQTPGVPQYTYQNSMMANVPKCPNQSETQQLKEPKKMWTCDACDVTVESERALKAHRKSHVKCTECPFEGAPKFVKAHYQANHGKFSGSGFKTVTVAIPGCRVQRFRICVGKRPEDIQKWIADRKKRFPRRQKVEPKKADDDAKNTTKEAMGLSSLLGGYGSSSESEDENTKKVKEEKNDAMKKEPEEALDQTTEPSAAEKDSTFPTSNIPPSRKSRPCRYFMKNGKCLNGDACRFSHDLSNQPRQKLESRKRKRGKSSSNDTLLRKLLSNDMDREETLALQLLEHIFDSKFYDGEHGRSQKS